MKRHYLVLALIILTCLTAYGQKSKVSCDCAKSMYAGTKADTTFHMSNGKTIVLCGYKNPESNPTDYSEFILSVCGQDTIIDFWGALKTCRLKVSKDTLLVQEIESLPLGKNFKYIPTHWSTEKIYFKGQKTLRKLFVNRQIRKYSQDEISQVLKTVENAKKGQDVDKEQIEYRLFIATISGNKTARQYFTEYMTKFYPVGAADEEQYDYLVKMLKLWDKKA